MRRLSLLLLAALVAAFAAAPAEADAAKRRPFKKQLTVFRSCDGLVAFAERRVRQFGTDVFDPRRPVTIMPSLAGRPVAQREGQATADAQGGAPQPAVAPASPVAGQDFSGTNVQEAGVDEPDAVKTDGNRLYVAMDQKLHVIDVSGDAPTLVSTLPLEGYSHELLLRKGKLLVISSGGFAGPIPTPMPVAEAAQDSPPSSEPAQPPPSQSSPIAPDSFVPYVPRTQIHEIDTDTLKVVRTLDLPGSIIGGRLRGGTARIAISTPTGVLPEEDAPKLRKWMPTLSVERADGRTTRRSMAPCTSVRRPQVFAGLGLLTLLTIDLDKGVQPVDSDAILADASTVYASQNRMYFATERWTDPTVLASDGAPPGRSTTIHGFDVSKPDVTGYVGSGGVRGYLLNQFSMSEHKGALRVATTEDPPWFGNLAFDDAQQSESSVTVLDEIDKRLVEVGRVGGLGKGERIYSVRFVDDVGFVVTFRQTDPLYTLDLSDRTKPRVVGELKIPGYSSYLHPIGDGLMIGVGQDADATGRTRGAQVSLFDVSDLADPRRLHQKFLGQYASTQAEYDHHAFLYWAPTRLLVLPLSDYSERGDTSFLGAVGMQVDRGSGFTGIGATEHPKIDGYAPQIMRALVANGRVFTISYYGVQAGRLDTLAGTHWLPFSG